MSTYDTYHTDDLDALLSDVRRLLNEDAPPAPRPARPAAEPPAADPDATRTFRPAAADPEATRAFRPVRPEEANAARPPWEAPDFAGTYRGGADGPVVRSASVHARPAARPASAAASASAGAARPAAPSAASQAAGMARRQPAAEARRQPAGEAAVRPARRREDPYAAHARPAPEPEEDEDDEELEPPRKPHRFRRFVLKLLLVLVVLFAALTAASRLLASQPEYDGEYTLGARKDGVSTILLIGTDAGGTRTDTLMLLRVGTSDDTMSLVSIPRDTRVNGSYSVPKINGVYGVNGGGEEGMTMLLQRVAECIGFYPDGYLLVNLDSFVELVDIMGGVTFDVPQDMYYADPSQNLYINLQAGEQTLNGEQAMGLVRFRSGYAQADLTRGSVQRDFVSAAADQWVGPGLILKAPQLLAWLNGNVETDLSVRNLAWLAWAVLGADQVNTEMLPGTAVNMAGSYYILDAAGVADVVNRCLNPYARDITTADLQIRTS